MYYVNKYTRRCYKQKQTKIKTKPNKQTNKQTNLPIVLAAIYYYLQTLFRVNLSVQIFEIKYPDDLLKRILTRMYGNDK